VLRRALGQAEKWGLVARNVAKLAQPPAYRRPQMQALDAAQANRLLAAASGHRLEPLFRVALALGLRQGELLGLPWREVDLDRRELRVTQALQGVDHALILVPRKSERSRRVLPLPPFLVDALRAHRVRQIEERLAGGEHYHDSGLVFTSRTGAPLDERNVTRIFQRFLAAAELPLVRFHDLRHSCALLLLAQGVAPRVVMEILGHSQISITMDTYSHVMPALSQDAVERVAALFQARA
jgi:integrase